MNQQTMYAQAGRTTDLALLPEHQSREFVRAAPAVSALAPWFHETGAAQANLARGWGA